jgi:hypothetical protein
VADLRDGGEHVGDALLADPGEHVAAALAEVDGPEDEREEDVASAWARRLQGGLHAVDRDPRYVLAGGRSQRLVIPRQELVAVPGRLRCDARCGRSRRGHHGVCDGEGNEDEKAGRRAALHGSRLPCAVRGFLQNRCKYVEL